MFKLNKKASAEAEGMPIIEKILWIVVAAICGIAVYLIIDKLSTGI